jgi:hypothetical protein
MPLTDSLLVLYQVDSQVRGLRSRLESAERYLAVQNRMLQQINDQHEELQTRKRHHKALVGNLEMEMKASDERLEKLRDELNNSVTNKQYSAVLTELNTIKTQRAETEDQVLQNMEQIEELDGQVAENKTQITERTKVCDVANTQLEERRGEVGERLAELEQERAVAAAAIPATSLAVFDEIADAYEGEAMSCIEEIDRRRREYACGECNMHMPFEQVLLVMGGGDELVKCTACNRILYLQEETRGAIAKK